MTTEPTPLVTVLPVDRDTVILIGHHEGWEWDENSVRAGRYDDDETIQLVARHRLAALEEAAKVAEEVADACRNIAPNAEGARRDQLLSARNIAKQIATAIRALSNKGGRDGE